ncbi:MAG TPA: hypothetical protein VKD72_09735 [Gemmataceae bacterium]|nr:hypothetical protein [Gemmataceae bacterium]
MLQKELLGTKYSKAGHRRALAPQLPGRTDSAIEYKHQNISAALIGLGLPYIDGYKPASNFQALLAGEVETFLDKNPAVLQRMATAPLVNPTTGPRLAGLRLDRSEEEPPERLLLPKQPSSPWLSRKARRVDFTEREAANRQLGKLGEEFVVWLDLQTQSQPREGAVEYADTQTRRGARFLFLHDREPCCALPRRGCGSMPAPSQASTASCGRWPA